MVKVSVEFNHDKIQSVKIKGHAGSGEYGNDLVCAGVSSIGVGILNALDEICQDTYEADVSSGYISIAVNDLSCEKTQLIIRTLYIQLLTMEVSYQEFIKITKVEV